MFVCAVLNTISEFVVAILPVLAVFYLGVMPSQRFSVLSLLSLGFLVVIAGCFRTYYIYRIWNTWDVSWWSTPQFICSEVEIGTALVSNMTSHQPPRAPPYIVVLVTHHEISRPNRCAPVPLLYALSAVAFTSASPTSSPNVTALQNPKTNLASTATLQNPDSMPTILTPSLAGRPPFYAPSTLRVSPPSTASATQSRSSVHATQNPSTAKTPPPKKASKTSSAAYASGEEASPHNPAQPRQSGSHTTKTPTAETPATIKPAKRPATEALQSKPARACTSAKASAQSLSPCTACTTATGAMAARR